LHFSVLFSFPLEGEVKAHHLISLKKDSDILIGPSYWKDCRSFAVITKLSSNLCEEIFLGQKRRRDSS
jgi:hypothetical protein